MTESSLSARPKELRDVLTKEEIRSLLEISDTQAWMTLAFDWGVIGAAFALVAWQPNVLTIAVALAIIGSRQLGLAVVMHEAAHVTMFNNRNLNDWAGCWLAAYPVWSDPKPYRQYHLKHHAHTGGKGDPDLGLVLPFPVTKSSMRRKVWRDLSGQTGWKQARAIARRDAGIATQGTQLQERGHTAGVTPPGWRRIAPVLITNGVLLGLLTLAGYPALYLLWIVAWLTTYRLVTRLRSIAEHAMAPDMSDPLGNTRTTVASWWERLLLAPNFVNYHLEHHLLMTVPHYNLPRMHEMLKERGFLDDAFVSHGYANVFREAASRPG